MVEGDSVIEHRREPGHVHLAAGQHGYPSWRDGDDPPRDLVGGEVTLEFAPKRRQVDVAIGGYHGRHLLPALRVGEADHVGGQAGCPGYRTLDLGRCDVGACGLDHRSQATDEVHETVTVDPHEIAGAEPAVGVEALLTAALVVALHHERPADAQLAGVVDLGLESRCGPAERSTSVLGLIGFVGTDRYHTARLGHAEHRVPALRISGPHFGGHDGIQI